MKTAVVLYNLGGPCCLNAVRPFLFNLFNDKAIINLPPFIRKLLAKFIAWRRNNKAIGIYSKIGGGSPILNQTYAQATALEKALGKNFKVFVYMRYSYPDVDNVIENINQWGADNVIVLSLYPQYSTTTTASSIALWDETVSKSNARWVYRHIDQYPANYLFASAYADLIEKELKECKNKPIILFSAHGIPMNRIKNGDPYQVHVEQSVTAVNACLNAKYSFDFEVCYQSKVGPLKWLEPSTEERIGYYAKQQRDIIIVPIAFVSEHSETLVELDIDYKELALSNGAKSYRRIKALGTHKKYIQCLKNLVMDSLANENNSNSGR